MNPLTHVLHVVLFTLRGQEPMNGVTPRLARACPRLFRRRRPAQATKSSAARAYGKVRRNTRMCHSFNIVLKAYFDYAINDGDLIQGKRRICMIAAFTHISSKAQANSRNSTSNTKICRWKTVILPLPLSLS